MSTVDIRRAGFALTTPCHNCPFRTDVTPFLRPERAREIASELRRSGSFHCHKTTSHDEDGEVEHNGREQECAGSLILQENDGAPGQTVRMAERLGLYDQSRMNLDAPVYDSISAWVRAHNEPSPTAVIDGEEVEYEHCGVVGPDCVDPAGFADAGGVHENDEPPTCHPDENCEFCGNPMCEECRSDDTTCVYCAEDEGDE